MKNTKMIAAALPTARSEPEQSEGERSAAGTDLAHRSNPEVVARAKRRRFNAEYKQRIDLRGFGLSKEGPQSARSDFGSPLDVLAAVRYLHENGAKTVSVVGASMGGDAAEGAQGEASPVKSIGLCYWHTERTARPKG